MTKNILQRKQMSPVRGEAKLLFSQSQTTAFWKVPCGQQIFKGKQLFAQYVKLNKALKQRKYPKDRYHHQRIVV